MGPPVLAGLQQLPDLLPSPFQVVLTHLVLTQGGVSKDANAQSGEGRLTAGVGPGVLDILS